MAKLRLGIVIALAAVGAGSGGGQHVVIDASGIDPEYLRACDDQEHVHARPARHR